MHKVAIIGPLGAGKSEIMRICAENDYPTISADHIARMLLELPGIAHDDVMDAFPSVVTSHGKIDRHALAEIVFRDSEKLRLLEGIIHPHVWQIVASFFMECEDKGEEVCFVEVSAPDETISTRFDEMWCVDAPKEIRHERSMSKGMSKSDFAARDAFQQEHCDFRHLATRVIENTSTPEELETKIRRYLTELKEVREA
jgi:dephospho-CoA kinase